MFLTENYICFYASVFGRKINVTIPLQSVISIDKTSIYGVFENAIAITDKDKNVYKFSSFTDRS
jgi:hypothetical protein